MSKKEMTQNIASKIVSAVDDYGWRTAITEEAGFNRSRFDLDYVTGLDLEQLIRLDVSIANKQGSYFKKWWNEIGDAIYEIAADNDSYYEFIDSKI